MSLIYNATFDSQTRILSLLDKAGNVISSCEVPSKEQLVDDPNKPLMLRAIEDSSSVTLTKNGTLSNTYQTSTDGTNWTDYMFGTRISLNKEDVVYFRCSAHPTTQSYQNCVQFVMTGRIEAWHNAYSMIRSSFTSAGESVGDYGMARLFSGCASLTKSPLLVNALSPHCYYGMFTKCSALTQAPELPATALVDLCYSYMFDACSALTQAPELPATTLAKSCYRGMFNICSSLTQAPELPATTLAESCYQGMFRSCSSLTQAPELPATTLASNCYRSMFADCSKLKEVRVAATTTATDALYGWLENVSATGDFYCDPNATIFPTDSASGIPSGWRRIPPVDDITKPLTLRATQDGSTVKLTKWHSPVGAFETSRDGGKTWVDYTIDTAITLNIGDEVAFRAKANRTTNQDYSNCFYFDMEGKIEAWHNIMSLYRTTDFATYNTATSCAFNRLFQSCFSLTKAPALPATTLAPDCYLYMFVNCFSLTKAPELPATTLADSCYYNMFDGCRSLTKAPELPATTLADYCYYGMFSGCGSLTKAPELPATTLASSCYYSMFSGCESLTKAPDLPATTLVNSCYMYMFYGCRSLKEVRVSATKTATNALKEWLKNVSATGDFYCDPNATIFPTNDVSGIPENWTRRNIADYPN